MNSQETSIVHPAKTIGILLLLQMAFGLILPFVLWRPLMGGYPVFLTQAAASSPQIRIGVLSSFFAGALLISLSVYFWTIRLCPKTHSCTKSQAAVQKVLGVSFAPVAKSSSLVSGA